MDVSTLKDYLSKGLTFGQIAKKTGERRISLKTLARDNNLHSLNAKPFSTRIIPRIGDRFDRLVVTEDLGQAFGKSLVLCDCDCGTKGVRTNLVSLRGGYKRSCGCLVGKAPKPLGPQKIGYVMGQKYGRLTPTSIEKIGYGKYRIRCKCECGGEAFTRANDLRSGRVKSCGCLQREKASINGTLYGSKNGALKRDISWFFIDQNGDKIVCDSGYEVVYANHLIDNGQKFSFHPNTFLLSSGRYTPDFFLPERNTYVEIKGKERSARQIAKREEFKKNHPLEVLLWEDLSRITGAPLRHSTAWQRSRHHPLGVENGFAERWYLKEKT